MDAAKSEVSGFQCLCEHHLTPYSREFSIRSEVLSAKEILQSATVNAAKNLRMVGKLGTLEKGAFADMLILDANPLEDITILSDPEKNIMAIIKEGRVVISSVDGLSVDLAYKGL